MNGMPWWYFYGLDGPLRDRPLASRRSRRRPLATAIGPERAIGCVVYPAAEVVAPGVIQHIDGDRFTLGEPDGAARRARRGAWPTLLIAAGLKAPVRPRHPRRDLGQALGQPAPSTRSPR